MKRKILAVASAGGHWMQLNCLKEAFVGYDCIYCSTKSSCYEDVKWLMPDVNRNNKILSLYAVVVAAWIMIIERPSVVVTTGALPGYITVLIAKKVFRVKTVWIDSIANTKEMSLSGQKASKFVDRCFVQWEELVQGKVEYIGSIL